MYVVDRTPFASTAYASCRRCRTDETRIGPCCPASSATASSRRVGAAHEQLDAIRLESAEPRFDQLVAALRHRRVARSTAMLNRLAASRRSTAWQSAARPAGALADRTSSTGARPRRHAASTPPLSFSSPASIARPSPPCVRARARACQPSMIAGERSTASRPADTLHLDGGEHGGS